MNKLLDNAVKFTQKGSVTIDAFVEQHEESCVVIVRVTDTGIGIEPEQIDHIFNPFHQAQDTLTRAFGGSGLGLSFARDLTRALGGDITVTSRPNEGSCFTIRIETEPAQQPLKIPATNTNGGPSTLDEARVLIVDDAKDNRVLLQHFFKKTNATVDFAYDGQQAIDQVNKANEEMRPYHLILMDMQMPVLDGYAATTKLRQMDIHIPVLALTAHALDGDRERCLQAGCDDYLSKPVNRTTLIDKCNKLLNTSSAPQHTAMRAA
ncbi:MAG: response regulator [Phycisphaerales bacterium]